MDYIVTLSNGRVIDARTYNVLGIARDAKTAKSLKLGILTGICYLAPHTLAGRRTVCRWATPGCIPGCLNRAGKGVLTDVQQARVDKTLFYMEYPEQFEYALRRNLDKLVRKAAKEGLDPACRLDGTSDELEVWAVDRGIVADYPMVKFYGYTKAPYGEWARVLALGLPNLHVVYSFNEGRHAVDRAREWMGHGYGIAIVLATQAMAQAMNGGTFLGAPIVDGDDTDARFLEDGVRAVALFAKGPARNDTTGFVMYWNSSHVVDHYRPERIRVNSGHSVAMGAK